MAKLTASELARSLSAVLDRLEFGGEEIIIVRNNHPIAKIVPGSPHLTAIEAMGDLFRTIPPSAAQGWVDSGRIPGSIAKELKDPWGS